MTTLLFLNHKTHRKFVASVLFKTYISLFLELTYILGPSGSEIHPRSDSTELADRGMRNFREIILLVVFRNLYSTEARKVQVVNKDYTIIYSISLVNVIFLSHKHSA